MMAYDMHGGWDDKTDFDSPFKFDAADPCQASLGLNTVQGTVSYMLGKGVPASKLVIGVPFYGYEYTGVAGERIRRRPLRPVPAVHGCSHAISTYKDIVTASISPVGARLFRAPERRRRRTVAVERFWERRHVHHVRERRLDREPRGLRQRQGPARPDPRRRPVISSTITCPRPRGQVAPRWRTEGRAIPTGRGGLESRPPRHAPAAVSRRRRPAASSGNGPEPGRTDRRGRSGPMSRPKPRRRSRPRLRR